MYIYITYKLNMYLCMLYIKYNMYMYIKCILNVYI